MPVPQFTVRQSLAQQEVVSKADSASVGKRPQLECTVTITKRLLV